MRRALVAGAMVLGVANLSSGTSYAVEFCNTTPIVGSTGVLAPSSPYPSTITVSGLTGTITDVNVRLLDVTTGAQPDNTHWVEDLDVMVSSPAGTGVVVMSDAGGDNDTIHPPVVNVDLTLDDQAANQLPADTPFTSGTYRPVDDDTEHMSEANPVDSWPAPAPAPGGSSLNAFNGQNPNGTWSLWAVDDTMLGPVHINGGWCVDIITTGGVTSTTSGGGGTSTTSGGGGTTSTTSGGGGTTSTTSGGGGTTTTVVVTTSSTSTSTSTTTSTSTSTSTTVATTTSSSTSSTSPTVPTTCDGLTATILGTVGGDTITGTPGNDVISAGAGNDSVDGGGGDDVICGGAGNDRLRGGDGNDRLFGDAGVDQLFGDAGNDTLNGGADPDQCYRGPGDTAATCEQIVPVAV